MPTRNNENKKKYDKKYRKDNKEKIRQYYKQYRIDNRDKLQEYYKQYCIENKDKLHEKLSCECGIQFSYSCKSNHIKSKRHQKYILSKEN